MKTIKKGTAFAFVMFMLCTILLPIRSVQASAEYEIVFKGGLHGSVDNQSSVKYRVRAGEAFPNEPSVQVEDGYVFTGWNKQLPEVGAKVDRKLVFVAKYDVVVDGVSYIVHYVNGNNEPIATPKTMMAEAGSKIVERAKVIPNYAYQKATQEFVLSSNKNEITFVYDSTLDNERIIYEEEVTNVTENTTQTNQGGNQNNEQGGQDQPGNNEDPKVNDPEDIENPDTPLAKGNENTSLSTPVILGVVGGVVIVAILAVYLIAKKRKNEEA